MACRRLLTLLLLACITYLQRTQAQKCVPAPSGLDATTQAYRSPIVIKVKVPKPSKVNHTAEVTYVFETKNGGLAVGDTIVFGPVKKAKGCTRMKKNSEYLLFLEEENPSGSGYHRITFDPLSKLSQIKKLKKLLCRGCVKAPKIPGKNKEVILRENRPFTFNCKAGGYPKPMATFFKNGKELPKKAKGMKLKIKRKGGGGKLKISKVKMEHAGVYTCQAVNFVGNASLSYTLRVLKDDCVECPADKANYCIHGRCCVVRVVNQTACRCEEKYQGLRCNEKKVPLLPRKTITTIEARYHQQTIAIMAVCIALLVVILICYIVYCKFKKSRSHIRKEIIARNGNVGGRPVEATHERHITHADPTGILADETESSDILMTGYRSTNLAMDQPQPTETFTPSQTYAFAQRPQTYDDVILTQRTAESQPLVPQDSEQKQYSARQDSRHLRHEANGRRRRKNGVAVEVAGDHSRSASDIDAVKSRRIDELKTGNDSMTSSASSLASYNEHRKPALPIDERLASMAMSGVHRPPAYPVGHYEDFPDSGHRPQPELQPPTGALGREPSQHSAARGSTSPPQSPRDTAVSYEGRRVDDALGRNDRVTPHSPTSPHCLPAVDRNPRSPPLASPGSDSGHVSPRVKLPYQKESVGGNVYPYYEHYPQHADMGSPSDSHHDSDDTFSGTDTPLKMFDPQRRSQPSSPRQNQTSPEMAMGVPLRHGPVTVASARTHHLPLLTKEKPELPSVDPESRARCGSTVSLSSSSSNRSSQGAQQNRNSHKIEV